MHRTVETHETVKTLLISIANNNNFDISIDPNNIQLPLIQYDNIFFATPWSFGYVAKISAIIASSFIPLLLGGAAGIGALMITIGSTGGGAVGISNLFAECYGIGIAVTLFLLAGYLLLNYSAYKHDPRKAKNKESIFINTTLIKSQQHKESVYFVREQSLPNRFTLTVNDAQTNLPYTTFAVPLHNSGTRTVENQK